MTEQEKIDADRIKDWYYQERMIRSYRDTVPVPPEKTLLFAKFKTDVNYPMKNIAEIAARDIIAAIFQDSENKYRAYITTDRDDVLGGVDIILEMKDDR